LAAAMLVILTKSIGISKEGLIDTTAREYGFKRVSENIRTNLDSAFQLLVNQRYISVDSGGKVSRNT
jgi:hypothetical protein